MNVWDRALDYLACPKDCSELNRRGNIYQCRDCGSEYRIRDDVPCFGAMPLDLSGGEFVLKRTIGEKVSSGENPAAEVLKLAQGYVRLGAKNAILKLVTDGVEIAGKYKLSDCQTAMLQQAITEARYDIETPYYKGNFALPDEYLPFIKGSRFVFEGACGSGYNLASLDKVPFRMGLDISLGMASRAQRFLGSDGLLFVQGDVCSLPLRKDSADVYMSFNALDRVPRLSLMSKEMKRVVASGGICILGACEPPQYEYERNGTRVTYVPENERLGAEEMLQKAGCSISGKKEFPWTISTVLDGLENLTTAIYVGKKW